MTHSNRLFLLLAACLRLSLPAGLRGQVAGEWDGGEAFGRMRLSQNGSPVSGDYAVKSGRIWGALQGDLLDGYWSQETATTRCLQPASDGRYYWGRVLLRFTGDRFYGGWSYCQDTPSLDGSAVGTRLATPRTAQPPPPLVLLTSSRTVDYDDYHLKIAAGWALPESFDKGKWVVTYGAPLRNGPPSPVTRLHVDLYVQGRPYAGESERQQAVAEMREAIWYGKAPIAGSATLKVAGVTADIFHQKGTTGWRFYLFPYNGATVYGIYIFSPGDVPQLPPEALQMLASLKLKAPPKPVTAVAQNAKPSKDYLKNVGGGLNYFSPDEESELGLNTSTQLNGRLTLYDDPDIQSYVEGVGQRLVAASRNPQLECRYFVVNTREVNAFALPGCFVYVNRALIELSQTEGQLAGIIAHEIGHVIGRHSVKQLSRQMMIMSLVQGISDAVAAKSETWANAIATAGGYGGMLARLKYNRDDEHQADALAVETLAAAGYNPHDLEDFFRLMEPGSRLDTASRVMGILSTHPLTADREKVLAWQVDHSTYRRDAESSGTVAFQNCRSRLGQWPLPPEDTDVSLVNALAATGLAAPGQ